MDTGIFGDAYLKQLRKTEAMRSNIASRIPNKVLFITAVNDTSDSGTIELVQLECAIAEIPRNAIATRQQVIALLQYKNVNVLTLAIDCCGKMWCAEVVEYDTENDTFIRTKPDGTKHNNLGNLPLLSPSTKQSFNTLEDLVLCLFS